MIRRYYVGGQPGADVDGVTTRFSKMSFDDAAAGGAAAGGAAAAAARTTAAAVLPPPPAPTAAAGAGVSQTIQDALRTAASRTLSSSRTALHGGGTILKAGSVSLFSNLGSAFASAIPPSHRAPMFVSVLFIMLGYKYADVLMVWLVRIVPTSESKGALGMTIYTAHTEYATVDELRETANSYSSYTNTSATQCAVCVAPRPPCSHDVVDKWFIKCDNQVRIGDKKLDKTELRCLAKLAVKHNCSLEHTFSAWASS